MNNATSCRAVLARHMITPRGVISMGLACADTATGTLRFSMFEGETQSTVFVDTVAVITRDSVTEFLLDDLEMMARNNLPSEKVHRYLADSGLLAPEGSDIPSVIAIVISSPLEFLSLRSTLK